jgi:hypothetical protein
MDVLEMVTKGREAIVAFPEASFALFLGLLIGWGASFAFAHKELKVTGFLIDELRRSNISEVTKAQLLANAPQSRWLGSWIKSLGVIALAAAVGVAWIIQPKGTPARHLTAEQQTRLAEVLRLGPGENYSIEFNSPPNCDECEEFAQELRDFVGGLPGWKAAGGGHHVCREFV